MRQESITQLLNNIKDPVQKKHLEKILVGKIVAQVKCMSQACNGRVIGEVYSDGKINPTLSEGKMFLRATRQRLDGFLGFQCWCGNDSRLCSQEKGVTGIENNAVTKGDLEQVWDRLQKKPANYPIKAGKQLIDNFMIEEL